MLAFMGLCACDGASHWLAPPSDPPPSGPTELATDRFRLQSPGPAWDLLEASAARALDPRALAGAWSAERGAAAVLYTEPVEDHSLAEAVGLLGERLGLERITTERNIATDLGGLAARRFDLVGEAGGVVLRYAGLLADLEGERMQWIAWTDGTQPCVEGSCLAPIIDALSIAADRKALTSEADDAPTAAPDTLIDVGADFALRAGRYDNFRWQLSWLHGAGRWRVAAEPGVTATTDIARPLVVANHSTLPWRLALGAVSWPLPGQGTLDEQLAGALALGRRGGAPEAVSFAGAQGRRTRFAGGDADSRAEHVLLTAIDGDVAIWLLLTGVAADERSRVAVTAEATTGIFRTPRLVAVETRVDSYVDHRLGFAIAPPAGWVLSDRTPPALAARGRFVRWEQGGKWLGVVALGGRGGAPAGGAATARLLERALARGLGPLVRSSPTELTTKLGGVEAHHLSWQSPLLRIDLVTAAANGAVYALAAVDRDARTFEQARSAFRYVGQADAPALPTLAVPRVIDPP